MQRAFDLIKEKLEELKQVEENREPDCNEEGYGDGEQIYNDGRSQGRYEQTNRIIEIVNQVASEYGGGWITVEERLPEVETEVLIHARRKYRDGGFKDIITTAMYEDGTVRENDSCWRWEDVDGEWDEEEDCLIIPEGWWENKHYNPDGELNLAVDDEVIEWMPLPKLSLPEPYKAESE